MKNTFKFNKKRKHYSYIFKIVNDYCSNILLTTKSFSKDKKKGKIIVVKNIKLFRHPNPKQTDVEIYIHNHKPYKDHITCFDQKRLDWKWDKNDKRKIKRFKKYKKYYGK